MVYVSIGRPDSELLSNSMKVNRGGIIMKSHCYDADTYNRKVGLFLRNARVSFIMQSTVTIVTEFVLKSPELESGLPNRSSLNKASHV